MVGNGFYSIILPFKTKFFEATGNRALPHFLVLLYALFNQISLSFPPPNYFSIFRQWN